MPNIIFDFAKNVGWKCRAGDEFGSVRSDLDLFHVHLVDAHAHASLAVIRTHHWKSPKNASPPGIQTHQGRGSEKQLSLGS